MVELPPRSGMQGGDAYPLLRLQQRGPVGRLLLFLPGQGGRVTEAAQQGPAGAAAPRTWGPTQVLVGLWARAGAGFPVPSGQQSWSSHWLCPGRTCPPSLPPSRVLSKGAAGCLSPSAQLSTGGGATVPQSGHLAWPWVPGAPRVLLPLPASTASPLLPQRECPDRPRPGFSTRGELQAPLALHARGAGGGKEHHSGGAAQRVGAAQRGGAVHCGPSADA